METQLILCVEINYLSNNDILPIMMLLEEIGKMLNALINKITTNSEPKPLNTTHQKLTANHQSHTHTNLPPK